MSELNELERLERCVAIEAELDRQYQLLEKFHRRWSWEQKERWEQRYQRTLAQAQNLRCAGLLHGLVRYTNDWAVEPTRYRDVEIILEE